MFKVGEKVLFSGEDAKIVKVLENGRYNVEFYNTVLWPETPITYIAENVGKWALKKVKES